MGDRGAVTYKKSRRGDADVDRAMRHVLRHSGLEYRVIEFFPYGYDERQYCSPSFNLPEPLAESYRHCMSVFNVLAHNKSCLNQSSKCEPQLERRGLYRQVAGQPDVQMLELSLL